jgi:DNA-binding protein H-NS
MPARPTSLSRLAGIVGPLIGLFAVTCLSGTSPEDTQLFAARRQKIAGMTQSEIEQLKRNYEEFRKLSPERRKALQELDSEVEQDTKNGGHLLKLLTGYNLWLSKLTPFEQEKVVGTSDPGERAEIVKTIRDEQQKREAWLALEPPRGKAPSLSTADLDAMLKAVEDNFLSAEVRDKLPQKGAQRDQHLRVLKAAMRGSGTHNEARQEPTLAGPGAARVSVPGAGNRACGVRWAE